MIKFTGNEPKHMSEGAAGADLVANEHYKIQPGELVLVDTGTAVAIPFGMYGMLLPRSSICNKRGLIMMNSMGVIDSDFRGTMKCAYRNISNEVVNIEKGERIAQLIINTHAITGFERANRLEATERGSGGFGSTGK